MITSKLPGEQQGEAWGPGLLSTAQAQTFAESLPIAPSCRAQIARGLAVFPIECRVRGMFFDGLVDAITAARGAVVCRQLVTAAHLPAKRVAFSLYPHRDFYRLYFLSLPVLHPRLPVSEAMERVAETFYPVFRSSMLGRTMSVLMGSDPSGILKHLSEAYALSVPWNAHAVEVLSPKEVIWKARVEPMEMYPSIFAGIVQGTMRSHGIAPPVIENTASRLEASTHHHTFRIRW